MTFSGCRQEYNEGVSSASWGCDSFLLFSPLRYNQLDIHIPTKDALHCRHHQDGWATHPSVHLRMSGLYPVEVPEGGKHPHCCMPHASRNSGSTCDPGTLASVPMAPMTPNLAIPQQQQHTQHQSPPSLNTHSHTHTVTHRTSVTPWPQKRH